MRNRVLTESPTPVFPLYLLPSIPFRRRRRASDVPASSGPSASPTKESYLSDIPTSALNCKYCYVPLCPVTAIISKGFTGRHGRAYLVAPPTQALGVTTPPNTYLPGRPRHHQRGNLPNTQVEAPKPRLLVTGPHTVSDITCARCGIDLGWKYVDAEEESQKYKVGMFILETKRITRAVDWENGVVASNDMSSKPAPLPKKQERKDSGISFEEPKRKDDVIEFDSEDEEECEDLFTGIWTPSLAKKRRRAKAWESEGEIV